ncbi:hypothetical protein JCM8547_001564 [Rhodosporidiobolus lusitaniae]
MGLTSIELTLPDVPEGDNPFLSWRWHIRGLLNPTPSDGFSARLYVLFALMGYGIVLAFLCLGAMMLDYRRRQKRFWLWRLVSRPNGRYIVGNQHAIFAICSIISCCILIGFANNTRRVVFLLKYQQRAFFWRSFVWVPLVLHAWLSSWANLQAAILSGQKATNQHLLSPIVANSLYIGGITVLLLPIIVLDAYSGFAWRITWEKALILKDVLLSHAASDPAMPVDQAASIVQPSLDAVNEHLRFFGKTQRAVAALYVVAMVVIIVVNAGGLGLLFVLRKQIKFNTRRLSGQLRTGTSLAGPSSTGAVHRNSMLPSPPLAGALPMCPEAGYPLSPNPVDPLSPEPRHPLSPVLDADAPPPPKTLLRKVLFAGQEKSQKGAEFNDDKMTVSQLKDAASDKTPMGAANREQAKQLLALKKVEYDLFIMLGAIVLLAVVFLGLALFLAISPSSAWSSWPKMETAFFLIPWMYLVFVCASLTFLFFNAVRHLLSAKHRLNRGRLASVVGLGGRGNGQHGRASVSGLSWSDDLTDGTVSRPGVAPPPGGVGIVVERHVSVEVDRDEDRGDESPGGTRRAAV